MGYYECAFSVSQDQREAVVGFCCSLGSLGMSETDDRLIAYFPDTIGIDRIRSAVAAFLSVLAQSELPPLPHWEYTYLSERDWNETWKMRFVPISIGRRLSVLPPWEEPSAGRIPVIIDPGMAFGTGHHETTRSCLEYIEKIALDCWPALVPQQRRGSLTFLDVGTGTGILAIAAAKLGFHGIVAVDIDPLAVDAATRNVAHNTLETTISIKNGGIGDVAGAYDVIAANLISDVLIQISPDLSYHLKSDGILICSGMIIGQEDDVISAMRKVCLKPIESAMEGRWITVVFSR